MELTVGTEIQGTKMVIYLAGRVNTDTVKAFEDAVNENLVGVEKLILDFKRLEAISSAGLRVIMKAAKKLKGNIYFLSANETVQETLEMTGIWRLGSGMDEKT